MPPRKKVNATTYISNPVATGENIAFSVTPVVNSTESDAATSAAAAAAAAAAADLVTPDQFQKGNVSKKRGRKPKGGKIMTNISSSNTEISEIPNIILHLKCHITDLKSSEIISNYEYSPSIEDVQSYTPASQIIQCNELVNNFNNNEEYTTECRYVCNSDDTPVDMCIVNSDQMLNNDSENTKSVSMGMCSSVFPTQNEVSRVVNNPTSLLKTNVMNDKINKEIMKKINRLKISFHNSEPVQTKGNNRSACFWDTCDFDTQIFYIPTGIINDTFQVYGCFCSPECAIAYLLKEHLDTSTKFERLHLIQLLYGGITQYGKGLKPAPSPNFLLEKYYGNLSIQEYRQLFKGGQMIYVVNKPLTHILPELYEDNNDFLVNSKVIPTNNMKLKKRYKTMIIQNNAD
jgi:hypothetical protein